VEHRSGRRRLAALAACAALVIAACGGDDDDDVSEGTGGAGGTGSATSPSTDAPATTAGGSEEGQPGGTIVLGAEQFPECINPITQCANSSWAHWAVIQYVLPKLMVLAPDGSYVPSPLLAGGPVLAGEGIDDSGEPFSVTYQFRPEAVWDDGTPITCADVEFTRQAILGTTGTLTTVGTDQIESVAEGDEPGSCVITYSAPYAPWADVFGSTTQYVLKADAFTGTDLAAEMADEIPFSGGPYVLESFDAAAGEATFVRNEAYWDEETTSLLDGFTMVRQADQETELNSLLAGEVAAIYPQPSSGMTATLGSGDTIEHTVGAGPTFEGLWFTQASLLDPDSELTDPAVREALLYAVDRDEILAEVITPDFPEIEILNCGGWVPTIGEWCDQTDFADVTFDPERVDELLTGAGYEKGADGFYAKDGERLSFTWQTVAGNTRREAIQALLIPQLAELGIEVTTDNSDADTLFQVRLPQLQSEMALYAQVASSDPSVTTIFGCPNVPSEENEFAGQNITAWCNEEATAVMDESDRTPDTDARLELIHDVGDMVRADAVWLPLYQLPLITAWDTAQVAGPVDLYADSPLSGFWNIYDWYVPEG
jgi:peptide/nickel transport system substrate-binding protein